MAAAELAADAGAGPVRRARRPDGPAAAGAGLPPPPRPGWLNGRVRLTVWLVAAAVVV